MPRAAPVPLDEPLVPLDAELPLAELPDELLPEALLAALASWFLIAVLGLAAALLIAG